MATNEESQGEARKQSQITAQAKFGQDVTITDWADLTEDMIWYDPEFPWDMLKRYPSGPAALEIAVWESSQLAALGLASPVGNRMLLRFAEANPDISTKLKGQRLFLLMDVAINYAELTNRTEVRLFPQSDGVRNFCLTKLGLELVEHGHLRLVL